MKEETGRDEFESLLESLTPVTPDVSTASVLFEAGRRRGLGERATLQESVQKTRLRYWQLATAVSLLGMALSLATQFQSNSSRPLAQNPTENTGIVSSEIDQKSVGRQDNNGEAQVSTEKSVHPRHAFDAPEPLARKTGEIARKSESALFRFPDWHPTIDPDSRLAKRQRTLQFGVDGLPELENFSPLLVQRSVSRQVLLEEMVEGKEF